MLNIKKKKDYVEFGEKLQEITGCKITLKILSGENHFHYQLDKNNVSLGVLCYIDGELSLAPFKSLNNCGSKDNYIYFKHAPSFKDFTDVLTSLGNLVIE